MLGRGQSVVIGPSFFHSAEEKHPVLKMPSERGILSWKDDKKQKNSKRNLLTLVECSNSEEKHMIQKISGQ